MAYDSYLLGYRMDSTEDLLTEKARLKALDSGFATMGMGTKQFAFALAQNNDKLQAVNYVLRERGYRVPDGPRATPNTQVGVVDFSEIR